MKRTTALILAHLMSVPPAAATEWIVDSAKSRITFHGSHAGQAFEGQIGTWTAVIHFDEQKLEEAKVNVDFDMSSAKTGNITYDSTLHTADWLGANDAKGDGKKATFKSESFQKNPEGLMVNGMLTIKGKVTPITFPFTLTPAASNTNMQATLRLNRQALGIGATADPTGAWVSNDIDVKLNITVSKK